MLVMPKVPQVPHIKSPRPARSATAIDQLGATQVINSDKKKNDGSMLRCQLRAMSTAYVAKSPQVLKNATTFNSFA
jgi:hypothetical protein